MDALVAEGLRIVRGGRTLLDGASLSAYSGEVLAISGRSGSGKSSLLAVLGGLEPPQAGTVRLGASSIWPVASSRGGRAEGGSGSGSGDERGGGGSSGLPHARRFGLVLQGYGLLSLLTAAENVELALQVAGDIPADEVRQRAAAALDQVALSDAADHLVEELSGGQQQRVAVARALVTRPDVVLADEPTAELDADNREAVLLLLQQQAWRGAVVVVATHDDEVRAVCTRELQLADAHLTAVVPR